MADEAQELARLYQAIDDAGRDTLLAFARFLAGRQPRVVEVAEPQWIPPVEGESVVAALKRLKASYPMLDASRLLHQSSALLSEHLMQGRERLEVIEELELLFQRHYRALREPDEGGSEP